VAKQEIRGSSTHREPPPAATSPPLSLPQDKAKRLKRRTLTMRVISAYLLVRPHAELMADVMHARSNQSIPCHCAANGRLPARRGRAYCRLHALRAVSIALCRRCLGAMRPRRRTTSRPSSRRVRPTLRFDTPTHRLDTLTPRPPSAPGQTHPALPRGWCRASRFVTFLVQRRALHCRVRVCFSLPVAAILDPTICRISLTAALEMSMGCIAHG